MRTVSEVPSGVHNREVPLYTLITVQWNLSIVDTTGPRKCVLTIEVSLFQRLICTQKCTIRTSETREVSLSFKRGPTVELHYIHMYTLYFSS